MSDVIALNIKYLRKDKSLTQEGLAQLLDVTRAAIGSYEEGRAIPRIGLMQKMAQLLDVSLEDFANRNLSATSQHTAKKASLLNNGLRVLATVVDSSNNEKIVVIPQKASAGYTTGYADAEFVANLPMLSLPLPGLMAERSYRVFQIEGDSMLPIVSGSFIIGEYVVSADDIIEGACYIVLTQSEGIVYKRIYRHNEDIQFKSDNPEYQPYVLPKSEIIELWRAVGYISLQLPGPDNVLNQMQRLLGNLTEEVKQLRKV
jgi:transcriptional regulator with XRE-family HTH domain